MYLPMIERLLHFLKKHEQWRVEDKHGFKIACFLVKHKLKIILLLFCTRILPNFPMVVVLPTPLTPATKMTLGLLLFICL